MLKRGKKQHNYYEMGGHCIAFNQRVGNINDICSPCL